eukprot:TCONS_00029605-protein
MTHQHLSKQPTRISKTGSSVNIIDEITYNSLDSKPQLTNSSSRIFPYQSTHPIPTLGTFSTVIRADGQDQHAEFIVVQGNSGSILGRSTAISLDILRIGKPSEPELVRSLSSKEYKENIMKNHSKLFEGVGKLQNFKLQLHIDPNVTPVQQPIRRIPFHSREKIENELERLIKLDIIEPVDGPTTWLNPVVAGSRKNGKIRLCVDMRKANEAIIRERHVIPKLEDITAELHDATHFSKIDLRDGYHQIELDESSRNITTFATHKGLFRYKRLFYGVNSGFEAFQKQIEIVLSGLEGVKNISDDIVIWGRTQEEHDERLYALLDCLLKNGLRVNPEKCIFDVPSIDFDGHIISADGIRLDPTKKDAIDAIKQPKNVSEVRSLMGLMNYCLKFIPSYATLTEPIRRLTKKNAKFEWGPEQSEAFKLLKQKLLESPTLAFYNPLAETKVVTDASPFGLGAVLLQKQPNGDFLPVSYGSRSLSDVESRYSQTEREALAVMWACEHYHYYLYDRLFTVETDHKPLLSLLTSKAKRPTPRIQRWLLRLQAYHYTMSYIPGKLNAADILSRSPIKTADQENPADHHIATITRQAVPESLSITEIAKETATDPTLSTVVNSVIRDNWSNNPDITPFRKIRDQLSVFNGILLKNNQIVIPQSLQRKILDIAHQGHQGIVRTKLYLRDHVWWPKINQHVEDLVKQCHACQIVIPKHSKAEPLKPTPLPEEPWQQLGIDLKGPLPDQNTLLVILDYHSRYPIVHVLNKDTTSDRIIEKLMSTFAIFGYPESIVTDNGPQFIASNFEEFLKSRNINHRKVLPYHAAGNGEVERFNRTLGKFLQTCSANRTDWKKQLDSFLLSYRNTPHPATGASPSSLMYKHTPRSHLPTLTKPVLQNQHVIQKDAAYKSQTKLYTDKKRRAHHHNLQPGQLVLCKNLRRRSKSQPYYETTPYEIVRVHHSGITISNGKKTYCRHASHIKEYYPSQNTAVTKSSTAPTRQTQPTSTSSTFASLTVEEEMPQLTSDSETLTLIHQQWTLSHTERKLVI